jgi:hypothetical protein
MDYKAMLGKLLENMRKSDPERLARLEEMGYDTSKVYLHGTDAKPFDEFDVSKAKSKLHGEGLYFSDHPNTAENYAKSWKESNSGGRTLPVFISKDTTTKKFDHGAPFTGTTDPETFAIVKDADEVKSIWAQGMAKKGLMTGAVAMDPLKQIGDIVNIYRTNQEKLADAVTKQVTQPFGEADEMQKNIMRFALDPINLVPGAAGVGLTAVEMMGKKK